ncbi:MAG: hypothetical protein ACJZ12_01125 [Candidatus Neomarinimicrobiota bacterium]
MSYHANPSISSLQSGIEDIITRLEQKDIPLNIFGYGSELDTVWSRGEEGFYDISTNFGNVLKHIKANNHNGHSGTVIITDGQVNQGVDFHNTDLIDMKPIHIIGVGNSNPLVDVSILSINAPPVIIKGESAEIEVLISSNGIKNQKANVTLYLKGKLLGSKVLVLSGEGSINKIRFMISPEMTGEIEYKVQVNALSEEINILNNKQVLPIQVLKNQYKIAIITGAPNFNTRVIKDILNINEKFIMDHYYLTNIGYSKPLKKFWDTRYDLILFDNHPISNNAEEWQSFLRIFAKKILLQQTSFAIFMGNDIEKETLIPYLNLMNLTSKESLIDLGKGYHWDFTNKWDLFFPFQGDNTISPNKNSYPPLFIDFVLDSSDAEVLANFQISDVKIPLIVLAEKSPLRYMVFTSPGLYDLYYKTYNDYVPDMATQILQPIFSWLIRTGDGKSFYFRSGKNSYQQGEKIIITGKPVRETEIADEGYLHIYHKGKKINSKKLVYDSNSGFYNGNFWASSAGELDYDIELIYGDRSLIASSGSVMVQESQIETNNVYLNENPLKKIAEMTNGSFHFWEDRLSILNKINKQLINQTFYKKIIMHRSWLVFAILLLILSLEWVFRRRMGII